MKTFDNTFKSLFYEININKYGKIDFNDFKNLMF